jgi:uncharacterized protein YbaP (TraB family)
MKRFFFVLFSILILVSCRAAQDDTGKTLLWRISGKDLAKPSFLFGTIHLICPSDYTWTPIMKQSLAECRQVCFELDMDDPAVLLGGASGMMNKDGKRLEDYFTKDQWKKLVRFMQDSLGTDLDQMQMMKPMVVESILASKTVDCSFPISYEANILEQAQKAKQEVVGLEAVEEQIDVMNSLPDDSVAASLVKMTDSFAQTKRQYAEMLAAYKRQDLPALFQQINSSKELGDDLGAFLDKRNQKWIPRMKKIMQTKPTFFAVGAGHLWGDEGVINLLRKAGYTVTPMH